MSERRKNRKDTTTTNFTTLPKKKNKINKSSVKLGHALLINSPPLPCHRWAHLFSQPNGEQNQMRCPLTKMKKDPDIMEKKKINLKNHPLFLAKRGWQRQGCPQASLTYALTGYGGFCQSNYFSIQQ